MSKDRFPARRRDHPDGLAGLRRIVGHIIRPVHGKIVGKSRAPGGNHTGRHQGIGNMGTPDRRPRRGMSHHVIPGDRHIRAELIHNGPGSRQARCLRGDDMFLDRMIIRIKKIAENMAGDPFPFRG